MFPDPRAYKDASQESLKLFFFLKKIIPRISEVPAARAADIKKTCSTCTLIVYGTVGVIQPEIGR